MLIQYFYEGLLPMERSMIKADRYLISNMAENFHSNSIQEIEADHYMK